LNSFQRTGVTHSFDFGILKELELAVLKILKEPPNTRKEL
jgi:hypothetical protein